MSVNMMFLLTASLVGAALDQTGLLSTAPLAIMLFTILIFTPIANKLMQRFGKIYIFRMVSILLGVCVFIGYLSIINHSFYLYLFASSLLGISASAANFFRFAAMESAQPNKMAKALSLIMLMGVASSIIAPNLSKSIDSLLGVQFSAVYLAMIPFAVVMFIVFSMTPNIKPQQTAKTNKKIALPPKLYLPSIHATIANAVMVFVMGVTPAAMYHMNFNFSDSAFVIQWHMLGMFAPSLFSAWIIKKIGVYQFQFTGAWILLSALIINLITTNHLSLTISLFLLGVGWNFVYIGASTQLVQWNKKEHLGQAQTRNEMMIFAFSGCAMLFSGAILNLLGWELLNTFAIIPVLFLLGLLFYKPNHINPYHINPNQLKTNEPT
ncbi:hypothetical protein TYM08_P3357 [Marinicellulosiphila megalodicopiae]